MSKSRQKIKLEEIRQRLAKSIPGSIEFENLIKQYEQLAGKPAALHCRSYYSQKYRKRH